MPHRQAYPATIVTQTNSLWLSNRVLILKPLTQVCGSFNRVLWSQHCLHRDLILLGETHVDAMAELHFVHAMQIYMKIISNFFYSICFMGCTEIHLIQICFNAQMLHRQA